MFLPHTPGEHNPGRTIGRAPYAGSPTLRSYARTSEALLKPFTSRVVVPRGGIADQVIPAPVPNGCGRERVAVAQRNVTRLPLRSLTGLSWDPVVVTLKGWVDDQSPTGRAPSRGAAMAASRAHRRGDADFYEEDSLSSSS